MNVEILLVASLQGLNGKLKLKVKERLVLSRTQHFTLCTTKFDIQNVRCLTTVCIYGTRFVWFSEKCLFPTVTLTDFFITETDCVYSAVQIKSRNVIPNKFGLYRDKRLVQILNLYQS